MTIGIEETMKLIEDQIAKKDADYIYVPPVVHEVSAYNDGEPEIIESEPQCVYFYQGKPSCIVGHVLYDLGVTEVLQEGCGAETEPEVAKRFDDESRWFLSRVQEEQDTESPWGKAYEYAVNLREQVGFNPEYDAWWRELDWKKQYEQEA